MVPMDVAPPGSKDDDRTAADHRAAALSHGCDDWADSGEPHQIGRFEILGRVGKGSMGMVFEGLDPSTNASVAIKVITRISPEGVYRFKREFRALAKMQHPNVVSLYELAVHNEQMFYTMELVRGVDLLRYLCGPPVSVRPKRYRPCRDYDRLRAALRQLASGVQAIHLAGFLHRDIKPSNVIVARDGRVVLLDFGLVRDQRVDVDVGLTDDGAVLGTPLYMSPEQAEGRDIRRASDWYGMGALLYHALCGTAPFQGTGVLALLAAKRDEMPPHPRELVPEIPEELATLCWELLATDQGARADGPRVLGCLGLAPEELDPSAPDPARTRGPSGGSLRSARRVRRARSNGGCVRTMQGCTTRPHRGRIFWPRCMPQTNSGARRAWTRSSFTLRSNRRISTCSVRQGPLRRGWGKASLAANTCSCAATGPRPHSTPVVLKPRSNRACWSRRSSASGRATSGARATEPGGRAGVAIPRRVATVGGVRVRPRSREPGRREHASG